MCVLIFYYLRISFEITLIKKVVFPSVPTLVQPCKIYFTHSAGWSDFFMNEQMLQLSCWFLHYFINLFRRNVLIPKTPLWTSGKNPGFCDTLAIQWHLLHILEWRHSSIWHKQMQYVQNVAFGGCIWYDGLCQFTWVKQSLPVQISVTPYKLDKQFGSFLCSLAIFLG